MMPQQTAHSITRILLCYFSPTGTTRQVAQRLSSRLGLHLGVAVEEHPYTLPSQRLQLPTISASDLLVWATPVYAGRIPNKTLDYVQQALHTCGAPSVALVTFGNRSFDNALAELFHLMRQGGCRPVAAAALVSRHTFSATLAAGRPSHSDWQALNLFADRLAEKLAAGQWTTPDVPGQGDSDRYYTPLRTDGEPARFLKAHPVCDVERCSRCGKCQSVCPMGSIGIDVDGRPLFSGICIKCQACRRSCPTAAIAFHDADFLSHVAMLEQHYSAPKNPSFFL